MLLEKIKTPEDIKKINIKNLENLAEEVRQRIIQVTASNGGHIAPSLGATDLSVALLKVFDPLQDKIVWDVGHQSYAYKILTGRNDRFDTLRTFGGISGFNNIFESDYDAFGVGHSSTSISAALGMAVAKNMKKEKGKAIAIIGDGALTAGMSFEAINHAGHLQKDLIVILNDNNMSISKNVGALQKYLAKILVSQSYNKLKKTVWDMLHKIPPSRNQRRLVSFFQKLEENVINILVPTIFFEDLGFKYIGPIDGHNMTDLVKFLRQAKNNIQGPILIHVVTQKGKGYKPAVDDLPRFHGLGPFDIKTGKSTEIKKGKSYSAVFGDTLIKLAEKDKNIVAISAAMKVGTGLSGFANKFPNRSFDTGIAEQHSVTFAGGLATQGIKPFVAIYSTFMQRALDQVIHDIALQKLPVVLCMDRAGLVGEDGATHHGVFDLSFMNFIPEIVSMAPSGGDELEMMLAFASKYNDGPTSIRYPRGTAFYRKEEIAPIELGKFEILKTGEKTAIIFIGALYEMATEIANMIERDFSFTPYLINARFLNPFDISTLKLISDDIDNVITIEENVLNGGFGSKIAMYFSGTDVKVYSFGLPNEFITHGDTSILKSHIGFTAKNIYKEAKEIINAL